MVDKFSVAPTDRAATIQLQYVQLLLAALSNPLNTSASGALLYGTPHDARIDYVHKYMHDGETWVMNTTVEVRTTFKRVDE